MSRLIIYEDEAANQIRSLDRTIAARVVRAIERLADQGAGNIKRLRGPDELWLRVGDWRVFLVADDRAETVTILRVVHRGDAYR